MPSKYRLTPNSYLLISYLTKADGTLLETKEQHFPQQINVSFFPFSSPCPQNPISEMLDPPKCMLNFLIGYMNYVFNKFLVTLLHLG
jgi:hypothetical protein